MMTKLDLFIISNFKVMFEELSLKNPSISFEQGEETIIEDLSKKVFVPQLIDFCYIKRNKTEAIGAIVFTYAADYEVYKEKSALYNIFFKISKAGVLRFSEIYHIKDEKEDIKQIGFKHKAKKKVIFQ